ncbi:four helix bundle protein [Luteitalea pratensis]|jgi:four helix bundle protein|uniref:Four helix bundle protein n=1 Tax=Luteitalea pratensis TaxID=1855912 RepID=A0A143PE68_LUTPR|nr:four helix bundle protein [Luteitalea pratensis]AMY06847.1 four helix bundle protein [Luteitalea pratensis]
MDIKSFRDLDVWRTSMDLARRVYTATSRLPWPHRNEIGAQMRRASVSAPSNLAEGFRQGSLRAYTRHVRIAAGSMAELETQAQLATDLTLWPPEDGAEVKDLAVRTSQMLTALALSLEARSELRRRPR